MSTTPQPAPVSSGGWWIGWVLTLLPSLALLASGVMKLTKSPVVVESTGKLGWDESLLLGLAITELTCTLLYLIPQTTVLGAILLTGYLGGAIATHVPKGDPFYGPIILGVLVWGALWLREPRLRALLPLRI